MLYAIRSRSTPGILLWLKGSSTWHRPIGCIAESRSAIWMTGSRCWRRSSGKRRSTLLVLRSACGCSRARGPSRYLRHFANDIRYDGKQLTMSGSKHALLGAATEENWAPQGCKSSLSMSGHLQTTPRHGRPTASNGVGQILVLALESCVDAFALCALCALALALCTDFFGSLATAACTVSLSFFAFGVDPNLPSRLKRTGHSRIARICPA